MAPDRRPARRHLAGLRGSAILLAAAVSVSGCASSVYPFNHGYETHAADGEARTTVGRCVGKSDLALVTCQLEAKIAEIDAQHGHVINSPEIFDLPLIAAAGVASGLLLFDSGTTALSATGLAAGAIGATRSYFSPSTARAVLRRGSAGYTCLLIYGREAEGYAADFQGGSDRARARESLERLLVGLRTARTRPANAGLRTKAEVDALIGQAETAIKLFDSQAAAAAVADSRLRMAAHGFGLTLAAQADRAPIDFGKIVQALVEQAKVAAAFIEQADDAGEGAAGGGDDADGSSIASSTARREGRPSPRLAAEVRAAISGLLRGMVSMEALVAGFDTCAVLAAPDATPPKIEIVFATVDGSSS
ncbi:MAG: hypothetical protein AAF416_19585 [Pseudomonadota bacterium]